MHTYAHPTQPTTIVVAEYTGTLLHRAEVRTAMLDGEGHAVPMLCMDVELHNSARSRAHFEQAYPMGHHAQAEAAARGLKKGDQVTVQAPLVGVRLTACNATLIHTQPAPNAGPQPAPQSQPQLELV